MKIHFKFNFKLKFPETTNFCTTNENIDNNQNQQALNKLKQDQQQLKEQILILNKQREMAQKELGGSHYSPFFFIHHIHFN